jgi:hypothetical protein
LLKPEYEGNFSVPFFNPSSLKAVLIIFGSIHSPS